MLNKWKQFELWFDSEIISKIQHDGKRANMIEIKTDLLDFLKEGLSPTTDNLEMFIASKGIVNVHNVQMKARIYVNMLERFAREVKN